MKHLGCVMYLEYLWWMDGSHDAFASPPRDDPDPNRQAFVYDLMYRGELPWSRCEHAICKEEA